MDDDMDPSSGSTETGFANKSFFMILWVCCFTIFILAPCCMDGTKRRNWIRRIRERRWNVELESPTPSPGYFVAVQRYNARRLAAQQEQQEVIKKIQDVQQQVLIKSLGDYTKILTEEDILSRSEARKAGLQNDEEQQLEDGGDNKSTADSDVYGAGSSATVNSDPDGEASEALTEDGEITSKMVLLPCAGSVWEKSSPTRLVPASCAVCLSELEVGQTISWSSNPNCLHVFHQECVVRWFLSVAKKNLMRISSNEGVVLDLTTDPLRYEFSKQCPCCRREFLDEKKEEEEVVAAVEQNENQVSTPPDLVQAQTSSTEQSNENDDDVDGQVLETCAEHPVENGEDGIDDESQSSEAITTIVHNDEGETQFSEAGDGNNENVIITSAEERV